MGCNTSQDAFPTNGGENVKKDSNNGSMTPSDKETPKPESAKTITLSSNENIISNLQRQSQAQTTKAQRSQNDPRDERKLEDAVLKLQAVFRRRQKRKNMKQPARNEEPEQTQEELENEFRSDDVELCNAATKIQASFRGHLSRKQMDPKENQDNDDKEKKNAEAEELDIDLSDPDLNKAAVKIQASFRGHMTRKDNETSNSDAN